MLIVGGLAGWDRRWSFCRVMNESALWALITTAMPVAVDHYCCGDSLGIAMQAFYGVRSTAVPIQLVDSGEGGTCNQSDFPFLFPWTTGGTWGCGGWGGWGGWCLQPKWPSWWVALSCKNPMWKCIEFSTEKFLVLFFSYGSKEYADMTLLIKIVLMKNWKTDRESMQNNWWFLVTDMYRVKFHFL